MILVVGSSGELGGRIVRGAIARGLRVRALVRSQADADRLAAMGAEPVLGDLKHRASLDAACRGIGVVVTTANTARRAEPDSVDRVDRAGNGDLVAAARSAGVEQFIFTSANGVFEGHPVPFMAAKAETEAALRASGLTWTILAPEPFMETWLGMVVAGPALSGQEVVYVGSGERRHSFVSIEDVAAFAVAAIAHPAARDRRLVIGGPDAVSLRAVVDAFETELGRPIPRRGVAPGEPVPGIPPAVVPLLVGLDMAESVVDSHGIAETLGVRLTPLATYVQGVTGPLVTGAPAR
jgi:NADH dehydrogenase